MILLIDNYDSFTWNLYDYLCQCGIDIKVERNDKINSQSIYSLKPKALVFSPGPKTPNDAGNMMELIHHFHKTLPMLGICLGYQGIGIYFGAKLIHSPIPMHGKTSQIMHHDEVLFKNLPQKIHVMRYHSLNISTIPTDQLKIIAQTESGEPMGIKHVQFPIYGLQFHPESILTQYGKKILKHWTSSLE